MSVFVISIEVLEICVGISWQVEISIDFHVNSVKLRTVTVQLVVVVTSMVQKWSLHFAALYASGDNDMAKTHIGIGK